MDLQITSMAGLKESSLSTDTKKEGKLREACEGFEAILLKQLLTTMRKSVPKSGLLEAGPGQEIYQDMHDDQLARSMAKGRGMGLGETLYRQVSGQLTDQPGRK